MTESRYVLTPMNTTRTRVVVLDDDPTGIQTVHGCYLLTDWKPDTLRHALTDEQPFFNVLTNTRAYAPEKAREIIDDVVTNVLRANESLGQQLILVSRSDSTLRNHFPVEINAIVRNLEGRDQRPVDAIFFVPAFIECGGVTVENVHYLLENDRRIPVSETEFARDSVFDYRTAVLPQYIEEKTGGAIRAADVHSISLPMLRQPGGSNGLNLDKFLARLDHRANVVVNAESYADLNCFAGAVLRRVAAGKRFVFQGSGSLVKALSGIPDKPLLGKGSLHSAGPGLFVVGSLVQKTTAQMGRLAQAGAVEGIEIDAAKTFSHPERLRRLLWNRIRTVWRAGKTPVLFTSRTELQFASKDDRLRAGESISHFLATVVRGLPQCPSWLVSKGGITSRDILVRGLEVRQTRVLGQILPGVPVIQTPKDSPFPGLHCVIFPSTVGDENALVSVLNILN
jgi:uncharacterized protein YgbK (DUF1537 family)